MIVTLIGAGGVGGVLGLRLSRAGHDVRFLVRGRTCEALRSRGLTVITPAGPVKLEKVRASDTANELGPCDLAVVTVKNYDLDDIAPKLAPLLAKHTALLPLQNGVDAYDILSDALKHDLILKGTVSIKSHVEEPGIVVCKSPFCRIKLGPGDAKGADAANKIAAMMAAADGVEAELSPDIDRDLWMKFVMLASFSAVSCMARASIGEVHANADAYATVVRAAEEAASIGRALGIDLPSDMEQVVYAQIKDMPKDGRPSMLEDLEAGRRLELPWLSGAVVRLGDKAGIKTPIHSLATALLSIHAQGRTQGSVSR
ncbi:MAG: 2-dehydropantoate 2-reductase [Pseudorhodoplanes sp.]